tara:strand:+ start:100 stop:630 length:531 start_codon:yes stop_codon:yes gene_type:complete
MTNRKLDEIRNIVIPVMRILDLISPEEEEKLKRIPLGYIRKNSTRMHAVCRFKPGPKGYTKTIEDVKEVAIHPEAVNEKWIHYAQFLMFHEYLHAIGNIRHDAVFRQLEDLWPDEEAKNAGKEFGNFLRNRAAKWLWTCPRCDKKHPRTRKSNGRYLCRECKVTLIDSPMGQTHDL